MTGVLDLGHICKLWPGYLSRPQGLFDILGQCRYQIGS